MKPMTIVPVESTPAARIPSTAPHAATWQEFEELTDAEGRALLAHMVKRCDQTRLHAVWDALTSKAA